YKGAGTVEFLLQDGEFYLLEVNTRLQVEHPVTEEVMNVDLVKMQILTAQGQFIHDVKQPRIPRGHSIECRIYAENPYMGGVPSTGLLGHIEWPEGPGRRYEYGFAEGDTITSHYDPMIAKVIVWDETRSRAIQKMIRVLKDSVVFGVHTNIPYLIEILSHKEFVMGTMTTRFIDTYFAEPLAEPARTEEEKKIVDAAWIQLRGSSAGGAVLAEGRSPWSSYWRGV
ncbi:MAG: acetyl-CoA carboxylase biotin carboxylase subunit, partial [Bdellovibrio sp.]